MATCQHSLQPVRNRREQLLLPPALPLPLWRRRRDWRVIHPAPAWSPLESLALSGQWQRGTRALHRGLCPVLLCMDVLGLFPFGLKKKISQNVRHQYNILTQLFSYIKKLSFSSKYCTINLKNAKTKPGIWFGEDTSYYFVKVNSEMKGNEIRPLEKPFSPFSFVPPPLLPLLTPSLPLPV